MSYKSRGTNAELEIEELESRVAPVITSIASDDVGTSLFCDIDVENAEQSIGY